MIEKLKGLLEKLQNSDEQIKKKWLVGMSGAAMVIVIVLWFIYMSFTISSVGTSTTAEDSASSSIGFWQIFKNGLSITSGQAWNLTKNGGESLVQRVENLVSQVMNKKTITIEKNGSGQ